MHADNLIDVFAADGLLAHCLDNFAPRAEQLAMARDISRAIAAGRNLVVEAGTGTGKTLAYVVPVLNSGSRAIIATRTRTLQDQLFLRDLPMIGRALGRPATVRMLKGRSNYLCRYRLDRLLEAGGEPLAGLPRGQVSRVRRWSGRTRTGDIAELTDIREDARIWPRVTSTQENCLGAKCPRLDDCHVLAARQAAREADVVVANHHLLLADLTLREEGFGELLPGADVAVVDEAHHFPDVAQGFFNVSVSSRQLGELLNDTAAEAVSAGNGGDELAGLLDDIRRPVDHGRGRLAGRGGNLAWNELAGFDGMLQELGDGLDELGDWFAGLPHPGAGLERCAERLKNLRAAVTAIAEADDQAGLRWVRGGRDHYAVNLTPLDVSAELGRLLGGAANVWVMTSATLAVGDDFSHFTQRLGLGTVETRQVPSPFDYPANTRLYLPPGMPPPDRPEFTERVVDAALPVLRAVGGRAFLLFTSHRALQRAADELTARCRDEFSILVQGTVPRSRLLEEFSRRDDAVLLGTATFWEGVDIRGRGLVFVAIDRLPFASPGDPLLAARLEAIRMAGGNPFREFQLPQAVLSLKQGVGRLIRDYSDYGVVMICDPRIVEKSYGRVFIESLPPMPVSRSENDVIEFLAAREAAVV